MAFSDVQTEYGYVWNTYPVFAQEGSFEGAVKRFVPMPGPKEVFDYAMLGLPTLLPLSQQIITPDGVVDKNGVLVGSVAVADFLTSAITEIEQDLGCNLSEVTHFHAEDYVDGMFRSNFSGIRLQRWPATKIIQVRYKFPHATTVNQNLYQSYTIPSEWIYLRRNKMNIVASFGTVSVEANAAPVNAARGFLAYVSGFASGAWQPGNVEIVYTAGFQHDRLPANVADMIKTWAAHRYLTDVSSVLFPTTSVANSIDGIAQSVNLDMQRLLGKRLEDLKEKREEQKRAFTKQFGRRLSYSFLGA